MVTLWTPETVPLIIIENERKVPSQECNNNDDRKEVLDGVTAGETSRAQVNCVECISVKSAKFTDRNLVYAKQSKIEISASMFPSNRNPLDVIKPH